jgi:transcriptional regulator with XRE-family HTH domain
LAAQRLPLAAIYDLGQPIRRKEGAMTTTRSEPYPFVTKVIDLFGDWLKQRRELNELTAYAADPGELERLARELNVTPDVLDMLVRQGSQRASELPEMLKALGIDETALRRAQPALLRDMERVCSFCMHKRQCHQELAGGTAATNYVEYCENADNIDMLRFKS